MLRMLEAQAPAKQSATDTITTLSGRLASATLLEDRRAAILGLRSFAKEYPASVASGSLRDLISSLAKDAADVDTLKVILETLLMLFNPDERSPEASEDIALWLADEFTQRQENITILLDLLEAQDFYSRLYSLQLLTAISTLRPDRTQDCVLSAPLGTTRLVATLEDRRDAIRNAGLLLLTDITQTNAELQKLVAFEDAFNRIFALIELEGGIEQGGILVQDCLSLLANLARYNASNQSLFRETGCVLRLAQLLPGGRPKQPTEEDDWVNPNRDKNLWGLLAVLRLFLARGSTSTPLNQTVFARHGLVQLVLNLAFSDQTAPAIRAEALYTCADMIRGNATLQESFPQLQVSPPSTQHKSPTGEVLTNGASKAYIIDALLDLTLKESTSSAFDARYAACECVKAYCYAHKGIRTHFLDRAIEGHKANEDDSQNIIATLIRGPLGTGSSDAYRFWFSAVLLLHLIQEDDEAKTKVMAIAEGDAAAGEEVTTAIQAISGNLVQSVRRTEDERIIIGYLMLLCGWLFESAAAIDDFLGEGSSLTTLVQTCAESRGDLAIIRGMCAALIGIVYEFSTKDSPIPRRKLQPLLTSKLGRERYLDCLAQLRQHPLVRDFEVLQQGNLGAGPDAQDSVIFDASFIDFFKDNYSRLGRAIDRDPGLEINLNQAGVDRDLVDSLRAQIEDKTSALQKAEQSLVSIQQRLDSVEAEHRRTQEQSAAEVARIQQINAALQKNNEAALDELEKDHEAALQNMETQFRQQYQALQGQLHSHQRQVSEDKGKAREAHDRELSGLKRAKHEAEEKVAGAQKRAGEMSRALAELREQLAVVKTELEASEGKVAEASVGAKQDLEAAEKRLADAKASAKKELEEAESRLVDARASAAKEVEQAEKKIADAEASAKARLEGELEAARTHADDLEKRIKERDERIQKLLDMAQRSKEATAKITAEIATVQKDMAKADASVKERDAKLKEAEAKLAELEPKIKEVGELEEAKVAAETERDDLLLVLADLEEKRVRDKKRLKDLGQDISDDDEEDDDEEGDGDGEDEGDAEDEETEDAAGIADKEETKAEAEDDDLD